LLVLVIDDLALFEVKPDLATTIIALLA